MYNHIIHLGQEVQKNISGADMVVIAGAAASGLHYLLTKFKDFAKIVNWLLALVFPFVTTIAIVLMSSGAQLKAYPWVVVVAQTVYQLLEWIKRSARSQEGSPASTDQSSF